MLTLSESYYHTILTERDLISNGIHNFTDLLPLLPNNSKHFFESFKWTDRKFSNRKFPVYMICYSWLYEKYSLAPLIKWYLDTESP